MVRHLVCASQGLTRSALDRMEELYSSLGRGGTVLLWILMVLRHNWMGIMSQLQSLAISKGDFSEMCDCCIAGGWPAPSCARLLPQLEDGQSPKPALAAWWSPATAQRVPVERLTPTEERFLVAGGEEVSPAALGWGAGHGSVSWPRSQAWGRRSRLGVGSLGPAAVHLLGLEELRWQRPEMCQQCISGRNEREGQLGFCPSTTGKEG